MKLILPALIYSCLFSLTPEPPDPVCPPSGSALAVSEPAGPGVKRVSKVRPPAAQRTRPKASEPMILFTVR